jgi:hypothetical protein
MSLAGLAGGLSWAEQPGLCNALKKRFKAETFEYFGFTIFSFVSCEEITDALQRGFSMWADNHAKLNFFSVTHECVAAFGNASNASVQDCALAEIIIAGGATSTPLAVETVVESADASVIRRVTLTLDTSATCYYMDSTVCESIRDLGAFTQLPSILSTSSSYLISRLGLGETVTDTIAVARTFLYVPTVLGLVYLVHNLVIVTLRSRRAGASHCLFVLASLSHRWRLLTLLLAIPPLVDWKMLFPVRAPLPHSRAPPPHVARTLALALTSCRPPLRVCSASAAWPSRRSPRTPLAALSASTRRARRVRPLQRPPRPPSAPRGSLRPSTQPPSRPPTRRPPATCTPSTRSTSPDPCAAPTASHRRTCVRWRASIPTYATTALEDRAHTLSLAAALAAAPTPRPPATRMPSTTPPPTQLTLPRAVVLLTLPSCLTRSTSRLSLRSASRVLRPSCPSVPTRASTFGPSVCSWRCSPRSASSS